MFATVLVLPWRRYQFYMTAINDIGESELSEPASQSQCVTPATAPSRNPNGVCSSLRAAKQLVIVWEVSRTNITLYLIPSTIGLLDEPTASMETGVLQLQVRSCGTAFHLICIKLTL